MPVLVLGKLEFVRLVFAFERLPIRAAQIYTVI
nr:MAG TPA: hypothetical protein [Caudoviricetes sp.]